MNIGQILQDAVATLTLGSVVTAIAAMAISTFLRGFQNKNVHGGHTKMAAMFGFFMALLDITVVAMVVHSGVFIAFFAAIGSSIGWVSSMKLHPVIMKKYIAEAKKAKKAKLKARIEKAIAERIARGEDVPN